MSYVKRFSLNDYFSLLFKRILFFICTYVFVSLFIFIIFFVFGFVFGFGGVALHLFEAADVGLMIGSLQAIITKLSNYVSGILFVYLLSITCLVWDYELIKMKERENENTWNND